MAAWVTCGARQNTAGSGENTCAIDGVKPRIFTFVTSDAEANGGWLTPTGVAGRTGAARAPPGGRPDIP